MSYVIYFVITIAILVFVHELGHFLAAKLSGMRADVFAIGFGKRLFGWNKITGFTFGDLAEDWDGKGHTDYRLCMLPFGGYVKIAGMVDESFDMKFADKAPEPWEFRAKSTPKKVFVISAGVLMNLLLTIAIFWGINFFQGKPYNPSTTVGFIIPGSVIDSLGFEVKDSILAVNGKKVNSWEEVNSELVTNIGVDVNVDFLREGNTKTITIPKNALADEENRLVFFPKVKQVVISEVTEDGSAKKAGILVEDVLYKLDSSVINTQEEAIAILTQNKSKTINALVIRGKDTVSLSLTPNEYGKIGAGLLPDFDQKIKSVGFFESFGYAWSDITLMTKTTFVMMGRVFSGNIEFKNAFGGPIKIAKYAAKSANTGMTGFLYFLAMLSLSLAIINILPFPVLDGGHLVIIVIEGIIKREISIKVKEYIQKAGFAVLMALMAFIIYNDVVSVFFK